VEELLECVSSRAAGKIKSEAASNKATSSKASSTKAASSEKASARLVATEAEAWTADGAWARWPSAWLGRGSLLLLRSLACLFPTSDLRHGLTTPAHLILGQVNHTLLLFLLNFLLFILVFSFSLPVSP